MIDNEKNKDSFEYGSLSFKGDVPHFDGDDDDAIDIVKKKRRAPSAVSKKTGRTASGDKRTPTASHSSSSGGRERVEPTAEFNLEDITAMYARRSADRADEREFYTEAGRMQEEKNRSGRQRPGSEAPLREAPPPHRAAPHTPMLHAHPPLRMPHGGAAYQMLTPQAIQARAAQDGRRAVLPCREAQDDRLRVQPNQAAGTEMSAHPRPAPHRPDRTRGLRQTDGPYPRATAAPTTAMRAARARAHPPYTPPADKTDRTAAQSAA